MHLSFVLLASRIPPDRDAIAAAYGRLFPTAAELVVSSEGTAEIAAKIARNGAPPVPVDEIAQLTREGAPPAFVATMPAPVPNGEADSAVQFSLSAFAREGFELPAHGAHFVVTSMTPDSGATVASLALHTQLVAAVADAHQAVGVYEGNARATHEPKFYVDVASTMEMPLMLWTGVSIARPDPSTTEILTLGLGQLGIPNMLLVAPTGQSNDALPFLFDLAAYVARRGRPIGDGETVGRTAEEKLVVRYVPSPIEANEHVARIELADRVQH